MTTQFKPRGQVCGRPVKVVSAEPIPIDASMDHDYCNVPEPSSLDLACAKIEELSQEVEELNKQLNELRVQRDFGLERFASSDEDIRFYIRRKNPDVAPVDGTSCTAECLMASKASKASPHLLHLWKMNNFMEDGHHLLHNVVNSPTDCC